MPVDGCVGYKGVSIFRASDRPRFAPGRRAVRRAKRRRSPAVGRRSGPRGERDRIADLDPAVLAEQREFIPVLDTVERHG